MKNDSCFNRRCILMTGISCSLISVAGCSAPLSSVPAVVRVVARAGAGEFAGVNAKSIIDVGLTVVGFVADFIQILDVLTPSTKDVSASPASTDSSALPQIVTSAPPRTIILPERNKPDFSLRVYNTSQQEVGPKRVYFSLVDLNGRELEQIEYPNQITMHAGNEGVLLEDRVSFGNLKSGFIGQVTLGNQVDSNIYIEPVAFRMIDNDTYEQLASMATQA